MNRGEVWRRAKFRPSSLIRSSQRRPFGSQVRDRSLPVCSFFLHWRARQCEPSRIIHCESLIRYPPHLIRVDLPPLLPQWEMVSFCRYYRLPALSIETSRVISSWRKKLVEWISSLVAAPQLQMSPSSTCRIYAIAGEEDTRVTIHSYNPKCPEAKVRYRS